MNKRKQQARVTRLVVLSPGDPICSEMATTVTIKDYGAGEFVEIKQPDGPGIGKIQIDPEEWPALRDAINRMIKQCGNAP